MSLTREQETLVASGTVFGGAVPPPGSTGHMEEPMLSTSPMQADVLTD